MEKPRYQIAEREINFDYLIFAWQDDSPDNSYYLDLQTGDVKIVQPGLLDLADLTDEIEQERERYLYIPKPDLDYLPKVLDAFIETIEEAKLKRLFLVAKESPNALSAIKKCLEGFPDDLKRFDEFYLSSLKEQIERWLAANFVADKMASLHLSPQE